VGEICYYGDLTCDVSGNCALWDISDEYADDGMDCLCTVAMTCDNPGYCESGNNCYHGCSCTSTGWSCLLDTNKECDEALCTSTGWDNSVCPVDCTADCQALFPAPYGVCRDACILASELDISPYYPGHSCGSSKTCCCYAICDACPGEPTYPENKGCKLSCGQTLAERDSSFDTNFFTELPGPKDITVKITPETGSNLIYNLMTIWDASSPTCPNGMNDCDQTAAGPGQAVSCSESNVATQSRIATNKVSGSGKFDLSLTCTDVPASSMSCGESDTCGTEGAGTGVMGVLETCERDECWYKFTLATTQDVNITITINYEIYAIDVPHIIPTNKLYTHRSLPINSTHERIEMKDLQTGTYYFMVKLKSEMSNYYTVSLTCPWCLEDLKRDEIINILDLTKVAMQFGCELNGGVWTSDLGSCSQEDCPLVDFNEDGMINILDLVKVARVFGECCYGGGIQPCPPIEKSCDISGVEWTDTRASETPCDNYCMELGYTGGQVVGSGSKSCAGAFCSYISDFSACQVSTKWNDGHCQCDDQHTCLCGSGTTTTTTTIPLGDIVAIYNLDEGSENTIHDSSGYGNDGTIATPEWVTGRSGSALHFTQANQYIIVPHDESLNPGAGDFTVETWVKGTNVEMEIEKLMSTGYALEVVSIGSTEYIQFVISGDKSTAGAMYTFSTSDINDNNWHHIVGTREVSATKDTVKVYFDGFLKASQDASPVGNIFSDTSLRIGSLYEGDDVTIDEVKIYKSRYV